MFYENGSFSSAVPQYPVRSVLEVLCDALSLPYFETPSSQTLYF